MESYLMMLYVTLEQESALKNFFVDHGWTFCKPDLSVTTDKLGPVVPNPPILSEEMDLPETDINLPEADETALRKQTFPTIKINIPPSKPTAKTASPKQKGKRKTKSPKQSATKAKQAKIMTNTSVPEASESHEMLEAGAVESTESETQGTSEIKTPITVQSEDGNQFTIKIEQESHESDKDEEEVDKSDVIGDDDYDEDGDDDNDEATDIDYSYEEASTSEGNTSIKKERQSLGDNSVKVDSAAAASGSGSTGKCKRIGNKRGRSGRYLSSSLVDAYKMVKESGVSVKKAAKMCGVPTTTLRDRTTNRISMDVLGAGPGPVLTEEGESKLTAHINALADIGYGYTRTEFAYQATDYAIVLGKRKAEKGPFTEKWYRNYKSRYSEEERVKPMSLHKQKEMCTTRECVMKYYERLQGISQEYNMENHPENVYLMDELDIELDETAEECKTVTVIGAGSAAGQIVPPYFIMVTGLPDTNDIFMRKSQLLTKGFKNYLSSHFMKYAKSENENDYILLLYDGHKSHLSLELIDWAKDKHIVLFVIPPHESHIVKTRNRGVFERVKSKYEEDHSNVGTPDPEVKSSADVVTIAKKIYDNVVNPAALQSYFRDSRIFPLQDGNSICDILEGQNRLKCKNMVVIV